MKLWLALTLLAIASTASAQFTFPFPLPATPKPAESHTPKDVPTLYGDVDQASAAKVIEAIHAANKEDTKRPIYFYLQSRGGSLLAGNMIIDAMEASHRPVMTVAIGRCASMCAMIFEHGRKRLMLESAILMFHEASAGAEGELSHMASQVNLWLRVMARHERYIAARSRMDIAVFRAAEQSQLWLLTDEALALGLADAVVKITDYPVPHGAE